MNTKLKKSMAVIAGLVLTACTSQVPSRGGTTTVVASSAPTSTATSSVQSQSGSAELAAFVELARGLDMDCAHVDDQPHRVWRCYRTVEDHRRVMVEAVSSDHNDNGHLSSFWISGGQRLVMDAAKVLLPASDPGPGAAAFRWLSRQDSGPSNTKLGALWASWATDGDGAGDLAVKFGDFEQQAMSSNFDDFHLGDALDWGENNGLACSSGESSPWGSPYVVHCKSTSGPRLFINFHSDDPVTGNVQPDAEIAMIKGHYFPQDRGEQDLGRVVGHLITRISGNQDDGAKAQSWVAANIADETDGVIGVFNAELDLNPLTSTYEAEVTIFPVAYSEPQ